MPRLVEGSAPSANLKSELAQRWGMTGAVIVAGGAGGRASVSRQVNTATSPPPVGAPLVTRFHMLEDVTCPGGTAEVAAAWVTQNASAVNFSVDGQPLPAAAGFPTTGTGNIAVPCDGNDHKVTLTATGTGPAASSSRSASAACCCCICARSA